MSRFFSFVKFEHTAFALPLVLAGALLAGPGFPGPGLLVLILLAAAGARTCAMALNRIIDARIDGMNPRTRDRELPSGRMTLLQGWLVAAAGAGVYLFAATAISRVCLLLSPLPLIFFAAYPYLKRFTAMSHLGVGITDSLGPIGGWVAVRSAGTGPGLLEDATGLWLIASFSILWIGGFDIIYATLDEDFDRGHGLHSLPARIGRTGALKASALMHVAAAACLFLLHASTFSSPAALLALLGIAGILIHEHERTDDVHFAFFTANAAVSFLVLVFVLAGVVFGESA